MQSSNMYSWSIRWWLLRCHRFSRDQPQPEAEKRDPGNEVAVVETMHTGVLLSLVKRLSEQKLVENP